MNSFDIMMNGVVGYTILAASKHPEPKKGQSWLDTLQEWRENPNLQSDYKVSAPKRDLIENKHYFAPPFTQTPFTNALSAKQPATTEAAYNEAVARLKALMNELTTLAINEQGIRSELGYLLDMNEFSFSLISEGESKRLELIKQEVKNGGDTSVIIDAVEHYFSFGSSIPTYALNFFDYASDKFEGLPTAQIMQDLSTIKGWWDNNSTENLTLDDDTTLGFFRTLDSKGNTTNITLFVSLPDGVEMEFNATNLDDENSQILFDMFKQRENLKNANANLSEYLKNLNANLKENSNTNLNLSRLNSNANLSAPNSNANLHLSENLSWQRKFYFADSKVLNFSENVKTRLNFDENLNAENSSTNSKTKFSANSLLQNLLQDIAVDKNAF